MMASRDSAKELRLEEPDEEPRELRLTLRLSNNRIRRRREELGRSQKAAAAAAGIGYGTWCALESLRKKPFMIRASRIEWSPSARKMVDSLRETPDWLWSRAVLAVTKSTVVSEIDAADLRPALVAAQMHPALPSPEEDVASEQDRVFLAEAMTYLTPIQETVLSMRLGLGGSRLDEDGSELGGEPQDLSTVGRYCELSRERIRQIEQEAVGRLRERFRLRGMERYVPPPASPSRQIPGSWWWCGECGWTRRVTHQNCDDCGGRLYMRPRESTPEPKRKALDLPDPSSTLWRDVMWQNTHLVRRARDLVELLLDQDTKRWWTLREMIEEIEGRVESGRDVRSHGAAFALREMSTGPFRTVEVNDRVSPHRYRRAIQ